MYIYIYIYTQVHIIHSSYDETRLPPGHREHAGDVAGPQEDVAGLLENVLHCVLHITYMLYMIVTYIYTHITCMFVLSRVSLNMHFNMCVCVSFNLFVCRVWFERKLYIYIYIYIDIHVYVYIYIYIYMYI